MNREHELDDQIGHAASFLDFQEKLRAVADIDRPTLIVGERGAGKELAARRLHYLSKRWHCPLITLNCAALPPSLIETELFGHEAGAYTGADKRRRGRFEEANGGTIFLDEIGLIPIEAQEKILRVVEYKTLERVGSSDTIDVNVRLIGATNSDLVALSREGRFKQDLLDRLSFEVLFLPPLRYRREDIPLLAHHFARRMAAELGFSNAPSLSPEVLKLLDNYTWPGNIRELKNVIERATYKSGGAEMTSLTIDPFQNPYPPLPDGEGATNNEWARWIREIPLNKFSNARELLEREMLHRAGAECGGNNREMAVRLGISYDKLRTLLKKHPIDSSGTPSGA